MNSKQKAVGTLTLFSLTWPILIEILLHMLMGNIDTLMLSQYSDDSVAAVGVSNQILSIVIVMFGIVAQGAAVLISQNIGAKLEHKAAEISVMSISINLWFSLLLSGILALCAVPVLRLMNLPLEIMDDARLYMQLVGGFIFVQALIMTTGAIIRSYGYTKDAMIVTILMNIVNIVGNYIAIFGPFGIPITGVLGVGYSTVLSRLIGFIVLFALLLKRIGPQLNFRNFFKYPKQQLRDLLEIGIPSAGEQLSYNGSQMVLTYFMAQMGTIALTTNVYTKNIMTFIFLFSMAIAQGSQILIGRMIGAGEIDQAYKRGIKSLRISVIISFSMALIIYMFSKPLLGIFTSQEAIIQTGSILLLMTIILEPGRSFNMVMISTLRAAGDVKFPVYIGIIVMWGVGVTTAWFFAVYLNLGLIGIWISLIADEWIRGMFMLRRWKQRQWATMSYVQRG